MNTFTRFPWIGACMAAGIFAGCAAPYPYQPYPYQGYPGGTYGQPYGQPGYVAPGSTMPGGPQSNEPTPINPGTNGGGDAPMWNPDDNGSSSNNGSSGNNGGTNSGNNNSVPFYDDPSGGDLGPAPSTKKPDMFDDEKNAFETDENPFGQNETTETNDSRNVAFEEDSTSDTASQPPVLQLGAEGSTTVARDSGETATEDSAREPISLASAEFEEPVARADQPAGLTLPYNPEETPNPFGHDADGYRYLRGLVAYDDQLEAWSIIYNDKPGRDDEYGGVLTLADHPGLTVLNDNDVVYIEGHVSDSLTDAYGKPRYIVDHLNKLKPRSAK